MKTDLKTTLLIHRRSMVFLFLSLFVLPGSIHAQKFFRFGGIVAGQMIDVANPTFGGSTGRFQFGLSIEARLPRHFAIEVDALYQSNFVYQDYSSSFTGTSGKWTYAGHTDASRDDIAELLQHKISSI